jgi:hypothetical protein
VSPRRVIIAALAAAISAGGCATGDASAAAWVQRAAAASQAADRARARGDLEAARADLVLLVAAPAAPGVSADDRRAVLMDAYYRLAEIETGVGQPAAARAWVERGLALGDRQDLFTANLLLAQGHALEAAGEGPKAAASYHRALLIDEALLGAALGEGAR